MGGASMAQQAKCGLSEGLSNIRVIRALRAAFGRPDLTKDSSLWFALGLRRPVRVILYPPIAVAFEDGTTACRVPPKVAAMFPAANTIKDVQAIVFKNLA
jgi:hypothetical protein